MNWPKTEVEQRLDAVEHRIETLTERNVDYKYFLNIDALNDIIRSELLEQLEDFMDTMDEDSIRDSKLVEALKRVIAYNSVPGTYEDGQYDM